MCPFSPLVFHLNYLSSEVWRGLDKMQAEQPESYSRILEESVQWQNKANSVPEPYKVNHNDWSICLSNSSLNCFLSLPFLSFPFPCSKMGFLSRPESRKVQNKKMELWLISCLVCLCGHQDWSSVLPQPDDLACRGKTLLRPACPFSSHSRGNTEPHPRPLRLLSVCQPLR